MRVVFLEDVPRVATAGEVKVVKDGYGRNYLMPRGLATPATASVLKQLEVDRLAREKRQVRMVSEASNLAERISGVTVTILPRAGANGRMYGSVTNAHIADQLASLTGAPIDHRNVILPDPIRRLGVYQVEVRISGEHSATVTVEVGEGQLAAMPPVQEAPTPAPAPSEEEEGEPEAAEPPAP